MQVQVKKWGNSASVRLPSGILQDAGLKLEDYVDVREENGRIVIERVKPSPVALDELINAIHSENLHDEHFTDQARGNEWI